MTANIAAKPTERPGGAAAHVQADSPGKAKGRCGRLRAALLTPRPPGRTSSQSTPKDGNNIFVGPWVSSLPTDVERTRLLAHEIGHVICGEGHPDQGSGDAPLEGTDRLERLMYAYIQDKISAGALYKNLLVKAEWDHAEQWLKNRPNGDN